MKVCKLGHLDGVCFLFQYLFEINSMNDFEDCVYALEHVEKNVGQLRFKAI